MFLQGFKGQEWVKGSSQNFYPPLDLGNSDVWEMQCFCSVVSKMVSEHDHLATLYSKVTAFFRELK